MRVLLLAILLFSAPAFAGEPTVYTNEDLDRYKAPPAVDQATITRTETDLKQWEKEKEAEEKLQKEIREARGSLLREKRRDDERTSPGPTEQAKISKKSKRT